MESNIGWIDAVEDLVDKGETEAAIALLESVISNHKTLDPSPASGDLRLALALNDLADLQSSRGFSLKADALRSEALILRSRASKIKDAEQIDSKVTEEVEEARISNPSNSHGEDEDDWEAVADREASGDALFSLQLQPGVASSPPMEDRGPVAPKRRGRGSFFYTKSCLYSDHPDTGSTFDENSDSEDEVEARGGRLDGNSSTARNARFGTSHVLVLYDFPPSTRTIDLEKLFENFQDRGFAIRWVDDTVAVSVFRTPSVAREAQASIRFPFKVRPLGEDDALLNQLSSEDLEPPYPRPKTSARTAQRLIARGMGVKLPTNFGSKELRKQEEERKSRIITRQSMKDEAWGPDKL